MKKTIVSFISLCTFFAFIFLSQSSCKKETVNNITATDTLYSCTPSIMGLWTGNQQNATSGQAFHVSVKADGTMTYENIVLGTQQLCVGTWTLVNTTFTFNTTCVYGRPGNVGVQQSFTATFNTSTGTLSSGQWVNTFPTNNVDGGIFTLTKVN